MADSQIHKRWTIASSLIVVVKACPCSPEATGRYAKLLRSLSRVDPLVLDWGPEPLNAEQRRDLPEIVKDRYDARSIMITSQVPDDRW